MNILISDSWLREYLKTQATPEEIKKYLSLCGPSIERINYVGKEAVYDVEVTSNRPDAMSIVGIAREATAILPRFGIKAKLVNDPYKLKIKDQRLRIKDSDKKVKITTDQKLNSRWTSVIIDNVKIGPSPKWLQKRLELAGIRPLNNVIDITNYLMLAYGQPAHAFDFSEIKSKKGIPTMILRAAKKNEQLTTLDGKLHHLNNGDIVIEDGSGRLIDLCGIMGALNSSIKEQTKTVLLFMQTYDAVQIRKTMMTLSHRTQAGTLFEKGLDSELVLPTVLKGIELIKELTGGKVASRIYDIYPQPYKSYQVSVTKEKLFSYLGRTLTDKEILSILNSLGLPCQSDTLQKGLVTINVPSFRQDIKIDVDIIEEIARIYGYHNLIDKLPDTQPPQTFIDPVLTWEEEIKLRLRDWGYTETLTYSMISEELMDIFHFDKSQAYKISNPLSSEWVYMRPSILPSLLVCLKQNLSHASQPQLFELSMIYQYRENDLPNETATLMVCLTGNKFLQAKGLVESLSQILGIEFTVSSDVPDFYWNKLKTLVWKNFGFVGELDPQLLAKFGITIPVTAVNLNISELVKYAHPNKKYLPLPKYPAVVEDLTFILPTKTPIGVLLNEIKSFSSLISNVFIKYQYQNTVTFTINYLDEKQTISSIDVLKIRSSLVKHLENKFLVKLKGQVE